MVGPLLFSPLHCVVCERERASLHQYPTKPDAHQSKPLSVRFHESITRPFNPTFAISIFITIFVTAVSHPSVIPTRYLLNSMRVLQNCRMIRNMENMQVKAAKNDDESSIVLTSIVITEHDLYWTAGQHDLGILPCTCTLCNTSVG